MEDLVKRLNQIKTDLVSIKEQNKKLLQSEIEKGNEISRLRLLLEVQNSTIKEMEHKLKIKRIADEVADGGTESLSSRELKFKINEMIKEVDKVMALLHQ